MNGMNFFEKFNNNDGDKIENPQNKISTESSNAANENSYSGGGSRSENDESRPPAETNNTNNTNTANNDTSSDLIDFNDEDLMQRPNSGVNGEGVEAEEGEAEEGEIERERPIILYEADAQRFVEVFRSTHVVRWWDSENGVYVPVFSQAIDEWLDANPLYLSEDEMSDGDSEDEPRSPIWNY